jgi:cell wall-associated NlpC family hydrolase
MNAQLHVSERHAGRRATLRRRSAGLVITLGLAGALLPVTAHAAPAPAESVHVVQAGENLYRIAVNLHVSLDALLAANNMKPDSLILPGQKLVVPAGAIQPVVAPVVAGPSAAVTVPVQVATSAIYIVKSGDGLYQIAQKLGVKLDDLLAANGLKITSVIVPGQPLKVPANAKPLTATSPSEAGQQATRTGTAATPTPAPVPAPAPASSPSPNQAKLQSTASSKAAQALAFAQAQLGKPYVFAAAGPDAYDCSGLVVAAYASVGVKLPHHSATQATYGVAVDWTTQPILPGDLVFTHSSSGGDLSHVGIAVDATRYIHAPRTGDVVRMALMPPATTIQAVRRIIPG